MANVAGFPLGQIEARDLADRVIDLAAGCAMVVSVKTADMAVFAFAGG